MIPEFTNEGLLPAGIHLATLLELESRFVYNPKRRQIYQGLQVLISDLTKVGCSVFYIDGSFVTSKARPGDMDICWEIKHDPNYISFVNLVAPVLIKTRYPRTEQQARYSADVFPANAPANTKGTLYINFFQEDKNTGIAKGIIKIQLP